MTPKETLLFYTKLLGMLMALTLFGYAVYTVRRQLGH